MKEEQVKHLNKISKLQDELSSEWTDYWFNYSAYDTWQFWVNIAFIIIPLIVLYIFMDREKAFHIGFYGFAVHVLMAFIDGFGTNQSLWEYPFKTNPVLPINIALDTAFVPVLFMLLYQWTLNQKKNYYVWFLGICLFMAFIFKPIAAGHHLFRLQSGTKYYHVFIAFVAVALLSKLVTEIFKFFERHPKSKKVLDD